MKFFELASCLAPAVPGGYARAQFLRELISMFTNVTEDEWATRRDPSALPTDAVLESMMSRDSGFSKKLAGAICSRLSTSNFIDHMNDLDLPTQELIAQNLAAYGEQVDLTDFALEVTTLLVEILHAKAGVSPAVTVVMERAKIEAALSKYRELLLVRSRGCAKCGTPLRTDSHESSRSSYGIVFLDSDTDSYVPDDFAVMCKPCAERYNLAHTTDDVTQLRSGNRALSAAETVDAGLVPLGLDGRITQLLTVINQLPLDQAVPDAGYDVVELAKKLDDSALLRQCKDAMATYDAVVRNAAKSLEAQGLLDFDEMRHQIRSAWFVMRNSGMSQYDIWRRLAAWIHEHTRVDEYVCGIIVSFMIQICDVFKPRESVVSE